MEQASKSDVIYWAPPAAMLLGLAAGLFYDLPAQISWATPLLLIPCPWLLKHYQRNLVVLVSLSALTLGIGISAQALTKQMQSLPAEQDLDKAYKIRARVLYQWDTDYGSAIRVDRVEILSPEKTPWKLDRLTLYLPELDGKAPRRSTISGWVRLKRRWDPRPIPWPMQNLRDRYMPRIVGSVKSLKLMDLELLPYSEGASNLSQANRELVDLFFKGMPSKIWRDRLEPFGLGHLLAISGLHCIFVYFLLQLLLSPVRRPWVRILWTVLGLLAFAWWVGWTASVKRASLMLAIWQILPGLGRRRSWIRLWCALMLIALISDPLLFLMRGFWYSFAASLGLILGMGVWQEPSPLIHPWMKRIRPLLPIVSAQLMVTPINLMFDCRTSFTSLFWNMLGMMFLTLILGLLALALLGLTMSWLAVAANAVESMISSVIDLIALPDGWLELVRFPYDPGPTLTVLMVLICLFRFGPKELRWYLVGLFLSAILLFHRPLSGERLVMLDVGQGLCFLHVDDQGDGTLFDAGGRLPGGFTLDRIARLYGVKRWAEAYVSHKDLDHYGILEDMQPMRLITPQNQSNRFREHPPFANFEVKAVQAGHQFKLGSLSGEVLWPIPGDEAPNDNEGSLVILLRNKSKDILLMGDAGKYVEKRLDMKQLKDVSILQVGHHGSKSATSRSFINQLQPRLALISCGRGNRFGHPHANVMEVLHEVDAEIVDTSQFGTYMIMSHGQFHINPGNDSK